MYRYTETYSDGEEEKSGSQGGEFHICLHKHESFFSGVGEGDESPVICAVKNCAMRALGENYLCAHTEVGPNLHDYAALDRLRHKVWDIGNNELFEDMFYVGELIIYLDNLVRISYIGGENKGPSILFPQTGEWERTNIYLGEMEDMLTRYRTRGCKALNRGDRTRFDLIVKNIQLHEQKIIESIIKKVELIENKKDSLD